MKLTETPSRATRTSGSVTHAEGACIDGLNAIFGTINVLIRQKPDK